MRLTGHFGCALQTGEGIQFGIAQVAVAVDPDPIDVAVGDEFEAADEIIGRAITVDQCNEPGRCGPAQCTADLSDLT